MSHWMRDKILDNNREWAETFAEGKTREQLIDAIAYMRTALLPMVAPLSNLDHDNFISSRYAGISVTSKLFPAQFSGADFENNDYHECIPSQDAVPLHWEHYDLKSDELHTRNYEQAELHIDMQGGKPLKLDNSIALLTVSQSDLASSIFCGSLFMGDVRYAEEVFNGQIPPSSDYCTKEEEEANGG